MPHPPAPAAGVVPASGAVLPSGWATATSKTHGRQYYYCIGTGERVWSVQDAARAAAAAKGEESKRQAEAKRRAGGSGGAGGSKACGGGGGNCGGGASSGNASSQGVWEEKFSRTHSQPYWINKTTNETTWTKPADAK
jgi:hypothetical protein